MSRTVVTPKAGNQRRNRRGSPSFIHGPNRWRNRKASRVIMCVWRSTRPGMRKRPRAGRVPASRGTRKAPRGPTARIVPSTQRTDQWVRGGAPVPSMTVASSIARARLDSRNATTGMNVPPPKVQVGLVPSGGLHGALHRFSDQAQQRRPDAHPPTRGLADARGGPKGGEGPGDGREKRHGPPQGGAPRVRGGRARRESNRVEPVPVSEGRDRVLQEARDRRGGVQPAHEGPPDQRPAPEGGRAEVREDRASGPDPVGTPARVHRDPEVLPPRAHRGECAGVRLRDPRGGHAGVGLPRRGPPCRLGSNGRAVVLLSRSYSGVPLSGRGSEVSRPECPGSLESHLRGADNTAS